jgi:integrase
MRKRKYSIPLDAMDPAVKKAVKQALNTSKADWVAGFTALPKISDKTQKNLQFAFERFEWWIVNHAPEHAGRSLVDKLFDAELIRAFVQYVLDHSGGETAVAYCEWLKLLASRIAPGRNLKPYVKARQIAAPHMKKAMNESPLPPPEIYKAGITALEQAKRDLAWLNAGKDKLHVLYRLQFPDVVYRNGLMIAFLALIPLRATDVLAMSVTHVKRRGDQYWVGVTNHKTAPGEINGRLLHADLTPWMAFYLEVVRPALLGPNGRSDALWINFRGRPLKYQGLYRAFTTTIEDFTDEALNPHRVRHAAATFAHMCGFSAEEAADVLQHRSVRTVQAFYDSAKPRYVGHLVAKITSIPKKPPRLRSKRKARSS